MTHLDATDGLFTVTLDWKGFDSTVPAWLIRLAFEIIWSLCIINEDAAPYYRRVFDFIVDSFINTRLMMPDGTTKQKNRGIPSGSGFT